jgi:hypothetical protein
MVAGQCSASTALQKALSTPMPPVRSQGPRKTHQVAIHRQLNGLSHQPGWRLWRLATYYDLVARGSLEARCRSGVVYGI